jgi:hypothetical protein
LGHCCLNHLKASHRCLPAIHESRKKNTYTSFRLLINRQQQEIFLCKSLMINIEYNSTVFQLSFFIYYNIIWFYLVKIECTFTHGIIDSINFPTYRNLICHKTGTVNCCLPWAWDWTCWRWWGQHWLFGAHSWPSTSPHRHNLGCDVGSMCADLVFQEYTKWQIRNMAVACLGFTWNKIS